MDHFYRWLGGLLPEPRGRLGRAVARGLATRGVRMPSAKTLRVVHVAERDVGLAYAPWGSTEARAWEDESQSIATTTLLDNVAGLIADGAIADARDAALARAGLDEDARPSWACLAHPVTILLLGIAGYDTTRGDVFDKGGVYIPRESLFEDEDTADQGVILRHRGVLTTSGRYEIRDMMVALGDGLSLSMLVLPTGADEHRRETIVNVHGRPIPVEATLALPGRRLADVVDLRHDDPRIDAAIRSLVIAHASSTDAGSSFVLEPADWIACAPPPDGLEGWDAGTAWRS